MEDDAALLDAAVVTKADDGVGMHEDGANGDAPLGEAALGLFDCCVQEWIHGIYPQVRQTNVRIPCKRQRGQGITGPLPAL